MRSLTALTLYMSMAAVSCAGQPTPVNWSSLNDKGSAAIASHQFEAMSNKGLASTVPTAEVSRVVVASRTP